MSAEPIRYEVITQLPIDDVVDLYKSGDWWEETAHNREIIPGMIKGSFCFMIAIHGGRPIAMARVISDGHSDGYIQDLVVKPAYRNQGIGKELVRRLTAICVEKGLDWLGLIAERNTQGFYENLGFRPMNGDHPMLFHPSEKASAFSQPIE